nr:uncharacterized protein LOC129387829 [Dermacentor andersoni]XP_054933397.1 uncharacterized protein LOC129387829 [Dermacentor andersoni]XP_054933398.1 uncharacterized protein LOC129387829 [Dermacentor andersoni]XP_054933399.1 uncharacterized protein LOC129387829 [Dermacentor andersoni]XP_054933400.1 uncharacterized protein LOC129387829 [Dermacentor andersoni]XP_054933401.1 uncharacterized protein LOC129387829 [Dermacentor andersoni]XP_054933402.1 uncharacterized protein LOC129387829 [Dermac
MDRSCSQRHKQDVPFRTIVSENNCWQVLVSRFLQKQLKHLTIDDPYGIKDSFDVVSFLEDNHSVADIFSVDVEDLYYSIPHDELFRSVMTCVEESGEVDFHNVTGLSSESFISLLEFYLSATFIRFENNLFIQKNGVCIGSCVAPAPCNIFLSFVDRALKSALNNDSVQIFRYVDDFLVVIKQTNNDCSVTVADILTLFNDNGKGLTFTHELSRDGKLQFLDLQLSLQTGHACWMYSPRTRKELLLYTSAHSKTVKRAIALMCLESSLMKSCHHCANMSFIAQLNRLQAAGYPSVVVTSVSEVLLQKLKGKRHKRNRITQKKRPEVVPYCHRVAHNLKNVATRYQIPVVFSAPQKLSMLCSRISKTSKKPDCEKNHVKFVDCRVGVVYKIPLSCGKVYVGQSGRCVNERLREHERSIPTGTGSHLAQHCKTCKCKPMFRDTTILKKSRDTTARELSEAFFIQSLGSQCISVPSLTLYSAEFGILDSVA